MKQKEKAGGWGLGSGGRKEPLRFLFHQSVDAFWLQPPASSLQPL